MATINEDIDAALLQDVLAIYSQAEDEMLEKVAKRVAKGITTEGWTESKLRETQALKKDIEKVIKTKCYEGQATVSKSILEAYTKGKIDATMQLGTKAKATSSIDVSGITNKKLKSAIQTAFDYAKGMTGLPQDPDKIFKKVVYATGHQAAYMEKHLEGAKVIGDTIVVCKKFQDQIDDEFIMHEIGHKATKFGSKITDATSKQQAEELVKKFGFKDVKSMSSWVSSYAMKNPNELYPEILMEYYKSLKTGKPLKGKKKEIVEAAMEQMYNDPKKKADVSKAAIEYANGVHSTILDNLDIPMNLKQLILATNKLLTDATFQVLRNADDAFRQIQSSAATGILAGVDTRIQASQKMLNEFAKKGITTFVDKAGRNWNLSSYAEMCARTSTAHAALQGHIDRQVEVGEDLVKVSTIGTTCPICMRWQGVVLSISGNSAKYHSLESARDAGVFHPNCKHTFGLFVPELDGEGKVEPLLESTVQSSSSVERYKQIEKQRSNERNIRYWKRRVATAITPADKAFAQSKVKAWQYKNMLHCEKNGLRRQYARENELKGKADGPTGAFIGGSLKEFKDLYKDVIGEDSDKAYKVSKKVYGAKEVTFDKWLKDEIDSLDQLDIDKAQMKDASMKAVTPTSLYKKYIGDEPMSDYAVVSPFEKGSKEFKSGYARWLKSQIEEIGVSYKVKPKYTTVHEDIPAEDTKLSATEIYKKYKGEKPTDAYKKLGGEATLGMKYGKWVETQKKEIIAKGIDKTVPSFHNTSTSKTVKAASDATKTLLDTKVEAYKSSIESYKVFRLDQEIDALEIERKKLSYSGDTSSLDYMLLEKKIECVKDKMVESIEVTARKEYAFGDMYTNDRIKTLTEQVNTSTTPTRKKIAEASLKAYIAKVDALKKIEATEIDTFTKDIKKRLTESKQVSVEMKAMSSKISQATDEFNEMILKKKYKILRDHDLELLKDIIASGTKDAKFESDWLETHILSVPTIPDEVKAHVRKKKALWDAEIAKQASKAVSTTSKTTVPSKKLPRFSGSKVIDDLNGYWNTRVAGKKTRVYDSCISDVKYQLGCSDKEAREYLSDGIKNILENCEFGARIRSNILELVLSDDPKISGFKNLFEVGTGGGCTNKTTRANGENQVFGYTDAWTSNKKDRPFYGMVVPNFSTDADVVKYYKNGPGSWYGNGVTLTFDKSVSSNMTFTIGDSLDYSHGVVGCAVDKPEFRGAYSSSFAGSMIRSKTKGDSPNNMLMKVSPDDDKYIELQFHSHELKKDLSKYITHAYIEKGSPADTDTIKKTLDKKGISYTVY